MHEKIRTDHLERAAYVYVRQSSLQQVRHHREGQQRQYGLADRARQLGFARVVVDVRLFRPWAGMPCPNRLPYPIEELRLRSTSWKRDEVRCLLRMR